MKVNKVIFHNFMPFKDKQEIEFPQHETQNVMLLYGDNMRGKTSFLNAIRWGFYGVALGRHLRQIPKSNLINRDSADEGDWSMSVSLYFEHNGKSYQLNRKIEKRENISRPKNDADFKEFIGLRIDGTPVMGDAINNEINQVMPREVSRFFLFDGELLQEYENLLIEESEQGRKIKEHIESVLGVPALVHAREELQVLLKHARVAQRKDAQKNESLRKLAQDQQNHEIRLETIEGNLGKLNSQKENYEEIIDGLEDFLKNTAAVQERKLELNGLEVEHRNLEKEIKRLNEETHRLLKTVWKDVLTSSVQVIVDNLREERKQLMQTMSESTRLQSEIDGLRKSLKENEVCSTCGQDIPDAIRMTMMEKLESLLAEKSGKKVDPEELYEINNTIDNLEGIRSESEVKQIAANLEEVTRNKVELTAIENKRDDIKEEIKEYDTAEIMRKRGEWEHYTKLLSKVEIEIKAESKKKEENIQKQAKISQLIAKHGGAQSSISNQRLEIIEQLEKIFAEGINELRFKLKGDVEKHATEAFGQITTEKTYSGLQINQSYGLSILDKEGRIIKERSAGAEQVVALSLIDGLNKTSSTKAPIVMDTPLGRLDPKHRRNILQYLPDMSEQVVLLVHEGEIDAMRDTEVFAPRIGIRYEIKRISATQSRIDRMA